MSATLDLQPIAKHARRRARSLPRADAALRVATAVHCRAARKSTLEQQVAQVVLTALRETRPATSCAFFCRVAAEIPRVQRALEEAGSRSTCSACCPCTVSSTAASAGRGAPHSVAAHGTTQDRACHEHCRDQPDHRGHPVVVDSGLRRLRGVRSPRPGMSRLVTTKVSQAAADQRRGRGRPIEFRPLLTPGLCPRALKARSRRRLLRRSCTPISPHWPWNSAAGRRGHREPFLARSAALPRRWRRHRFVAAARSHRFRRARHTPHGRALAKLGLHPRLAHMLVKAREHGAPRLACEPRRHLERARHLARGRRRARRGSAPACRRAARRCCGICRRESRWIAAP